MNVNYFTPPTTYSALAVEFRTNFKYLKQLFMKFFQTWSDIFLILSTIVRVVCEFIESVVFFVATLLNLVWLVLKIFVILYLYHKRLFEDEHRKLLGQANCRADAYINNHQTLLYR